MLLSTACVAIDRVSTSGHGTAANADTTAVASSSDGRDVAFQTAATNLVSDEMNGQSHVYRKDRTTGAVVNVDRRGTARAASATLASISADGNLVAFITTSSLAAVDTNGVADLYVRDVAAGHTTLASVLPDGSTLTPQEPVVRADFDGGHRILFQAKSGSSPSGSSFLLLRDLAARTTTIVTGPGFFDSIDLSADGNHVLATTNCGTPRVCTSGVAVFDLASPYTYSPSPFVCDGATAAGQSADGRVVLLNRGTAANCSSGPFIFDRDTAAEIDVGFGGTPSVRAVALSGDGQVALLTAPDTVLPGGTTGFVGLFARRTTSGTSERVGTNAKGESANASQRPEDAYGISADGSTAVFTSAATNLVPADTTGHVDGFARVLTRPATTSAVS
jgi:hypothetical protein